MYADDPIRGYMVRTREGVPSRLQGFIWYTTFTTWTHYFRWDSLAVEAGLKGIADKQGVRWDSDGELSWELELQFRSGDPKKEGVIWPRVGELAIVGALECGSFLVQLALEEMEASRMFDFVVVQATESSAGFYAKMGFIRVGALCKYVKPEDGGRPPAVTAYRHFTDPDSDCGHLDASIMMAMRLRSGAFPRRVLAAHGGIFHNLGVSVPVRISKRLLSKSGTTVGAQPQSPTDGLAARERSAGLSTASLEISSLLETVSCAQDLQEHLYPMRAGELCGAVRGESSSPGESEASTLPPAQCSEHSGQTPGRELESGPRTSCLELLRGVCARLPHCDAGYCTDKNRESSAQSSSGTSDAGEAQVAAEGAGEEEIFVAVARVVKSLVADVERLDAARAAAEFVIIGPGASPEELRQISAHIGGVLWEPEAHGRCAREKARLSVLARRKQSYLHVTQGYKPWVCYGKPTRYTGPRQLPLASDGSVLEALEALSSQSTPRKRAPQRAGVSQRTSGGAKSPRRCSSRSHWTLCANFAETLGWSRPQTYQQPSAPSFMLLAQTACQDPGYCWT